jgi:uncharacterized protein (TIGR03067 family)
MHWISLVGMVFLIITGAWQSELHNESLSARVARLVDQLGHKEFAKREAASKELQAIGEPARDALMKAAAGADPEVRRRAQKILDSFAARARAAAAKKELAAWQGEWVGNGNQKFIIKGDRWLWGDATTKPDDPSANRIVIVEVGKAATLTDMIVADGTAERKVCRAIFHLDGDTLHYCGTYDWFRPTEFRTTPSSFHVAWRRVQKVESGKNEARLNKQ